MSRQTITEAAVSHGGRVDTTKGVVFGAKLCGRLSSNGREYASDCLIEAVPLYEGCKIFLNHGTGRTPRKYEEQIGRVRNARFEAGAVRGDLHLNLGHAATKQILHDAIHAPDSLGCSHVIVAETRQKSGGLMLIEKITKVASVDLVLNPATTQSLFESADSEQAEFLRKICGEPEPPGDHAFIESITEGGF